MRFSFDKDRDPTLPPGDDELAAERLFRLLLGVPRAELAIEYRIPAAPELALKVRALRGVEESAAVDDAAHLLTKSARDNAIVAGLVARSLWTKRGKAFANPGQVGELMPHEMDELGAHVLAALCIVSPTYGAIDQRAWELRLELGARHISNAHQVGMLADCVDVSLGHGIRYTTPRPDRYFGIPICELTDGHFIAFSAARTVAEARTKSSAPEP